MLSDECKALAAEIIHLDQTADLGTEEVEALVYRALAAKDAEIAALKLKLSVVVQGAAMAIEEAVAEERALVLAYFTEIHARWKAVPDPTEPVPLAAKFGQLSGVEMVLSQLAKLPWTRRVAGDAS